MKIEENKDDYKFPCKTCGYLYKNKERANQCKKWCDEKKSCNMGIIKYGIYP